MPCFSASFDGTSLPNGMKFWHEILEALSYHTVKTRSLSHLGLDRYRDVTDIKTDGWTGRIVVANTRYTSHA